jgi:CheY-like chemotaxis protein
VSIVGKKILVVDDEPLINQVITQMLAKIRPEDQIISALGCKEALLKLKTERFDIIISDFNLTDGTGKFLFEQSDQKIFKVGISGSHQEQDFGKSCNHFLSKPFGLDELQSIFK